MIAEIQSKLRDVDGTPFALVAGAVALAAVKDRPNNMPAAFVIPLNQTSGGNQRGTGGMLQVTAADIGVVIIFEQLAAPLGDPAADELEALMGWVRGQLVGFEIEDCDPIEHIEGELVKARSGVVWWQERFGTSFIQEGQ